VLISREHGYHGTHGLGTALAGIPANRIAAPFVPDVVQVAHDDPPRWRKTIADHGAERVAAFFAEPVMGAGGVLPPAPGYLEACAEICRRHGVLFIADAVICGFGRLGNWFAIERFGIRPDMVVFAKAITSGYQAAGRGGRGRSRGPRHSGTSRAGCCATGRPTPGTPPPAPPGWPPSRLMEREGLPRAGHRAGGSAAGPVKTVADHPLVHEVRGGVGLLAGVELDPERLAAEPGLPGRLAGAVRERGVLIRPMVSSIGCSPPLTVTEEHLDLLVEALAAALDEVH